MENTAGTFGVSSDDPPLSPNAAIYFSSTLGFPWRATRESACCSKWRVAAEVRPERIKRDQEFSKTIAEVTARVKREEDLRKLLATIRTPDKPNKNVSVQLAERALDLSLISDGSWSMLTSMRVGRRWSQGREASRPAGAEPDQVRAGDQLEDREGARP
jgi:hypothetical protein